MKCYASLDGNLTQVIRKIPTPNAEVGQVLVRVKAIGINRADLLHVAGTYKSQDGSDIPGLEFAGVRVDTGERVCGIISSGAYAHYLVTHHDHLISIPEEMSFIKAAALPEALSVSWHHLYELCDIKNCNSILIHGAASGIGHILTQIALYENVKVYATASDLDKLSMFQDTCVTLSFHDKFDEIITKLGKVDAVIDILGGSYMNQNIKCCSPGGKIIMLASMDNRFGQVDFGSLLVKNLTMIGATIRSKSYNEKTRIICKATEHLIPLVASNFIKPFISKIFHFDELKDGHLYLKSGKNIGKIIVSV